MSDELNQNVLEILNFELSRKDMVVLGSILKSQGDQATFVDFETIRAQLEIEEGGRRGKNSLIYRSLSWLEKTGFVRVDRRKHKHGYNSDVGLMCNVFRKAITKAISDIGKELKNIDTDIEQLSNMDLNQLKSDMISLAAGEEKIEKPVFAQGWDDVLQLIDDKVYRNLRKGNLVRFSLDWFSRTDVLTPARVERLAQLLEVGIIYRGLEHNKISKRQRKAFKKFRRSYGERGYLPGYKVYERPDSTYQFVGRNNDGIILIVSENPISATWIPRSSNPDLVDNAIQTFDTDYELGVNIEDIEGE